MAERDIGIIGNYYGGMSVKEVSGKRFWSIENYDGHSWEEIPDWLYEALLAFDDDRLPGFVTELASLRQQLAASQAREAELRKIVYDVFEGYESGWIVPDTDIVPEDVATAFFEKVARSALSGKEG